MQAFSFISRVSSYLAILIFSISVTLRGNTRDTLTYKIVFENIDIFSLTPYDFYQQTGMEIGYGYLSILLSQITDNFHIIFFIISFYTSYFIYKSAKVTKLNYFYVLLCYLPTFFIAHQLMQIRQGLAVSLLYYSFFLIVKEDKNKGWVIYSLSILFHSVSIGGFWILFLKRKFLFLNRLLASRYYIIYILILSIFLSRVLLHILPMLSSRVYNYSINTDYSVERSILHPANIRSYLLFLLFFIHFNVFRKNRLFKVLFLIFTFGVGLRVGFYDFLILSGRLSTLFTFSEIFLIPILINSYKYLFLKIAIIVVYFTISLYIALIYQYPFIIDDYFSQIR